MPRYRVNMFVQHRQDEPNVGCHLTVKVDARSRDAVIPLAMHDAVSLCMEHHPNLGMPYAPRLKHSPVEMKSLKEQKN